MIEGRIIHNYLTANADKLAWSKSHIIPYGLQFNVQAKGCEVTARVRKNLEDNETYSVHVSDNKGRELKVSENIELDNLIEEINSSINL